MPDLHLEILPPKQRWLWTQFQNHAAFLTQHGYYLAGGTALALQLGHRQSLDFDFFSRRPNVSQATQVWLKKFTRLIIRDADRNTLHAEVNGVKVSFIGAYRYPTITPLVRAKRLKLAGVKDIALMKFLALTHRAALRDYLDLAAILRAHLPLAELLKASKKKYGEDFNVMTLLRALVTFTDIEPELPILLDKNLKTSWQKILRDAVKKIAV